MLSARTFSALNDEYKGIMKPHFGSENFLLLKYSSPRYEGIFFRGTIYQRLTKDAEMKPNGGSCTVHFHNYPFRAKTKLTTSGDVRLALHFDLNRYIQNFSSNLKLNTNHQSGEYSGKLKAHWLNQHLNIKSTIDLAKHKCFSTKALGLILNRPGQQLGVGAGVAFTFDDKQLSIYNATLWYIKNYTKLVLTHKTQRNKFSLGDLIGRIYNRINDTTDVALGLQHSFVEQEDLVTLGLRYRHSDTFTIKTKIDSDLNLKAAFQLLLEKNLQLVITSNYNVADPNSSIKSSNIENLPPISLRISFGDI